MCSKISLWCEKFRIHSYPNDVFLSWKSWTKIYAETDYMTIMFIRSWIKILLQLEKDDLPLLLTGLTLWQKRNINAEMMWCASKCGILFISVPLSHLNLPESSINTKKNNPCFWLLATVKQLSKVRCLSIHSQYIPIAKLSS